MLQAVADCTLALALLRHPRAARPDVLRFRDARLASLVRHAWREVPYYRRLFEAHGVDPRRIRSAGDLARIPLSSKRDLHARPLTDLLARGTDPSSLIRRATGGSTGEPLIVRRSVAEERLQTVIRWRLAPYYGYGLSSLLAIVSAPRDEPPPSRVSRAVLRAVHGIGLLRAVQVSCLQPMPDIVDSLQQIRPGVIGGYPSVLARVAQYLRDSGSTAIRPRVVITGGEVRSAQMRAQIAAGFEAPVYDTYGSHEFNRIASECRETGGYHLADDGVVVEVLDADGRPVREGESGEVVGTALHSRTMPFIRYRLGDIVVKGSDACACGAPFATIRSIQGRMVDYFPLPDGRLLHPYELVSATVRAYEALVPESRPNGRPYPWLAEYRYVQERRDRITVYLVPAAEPPAAHLEVIESALRGVLGRGVRVDLALRPALPPEANGKFRIYRSLVQDEHDTGALRAVRGADEAHAGR